MEFTFGYDVENILQVQDFVELNFTKDKPYVIYGYAAIPANKTLVIDAGARIYFHNN